METITISLGTVLYYILSPLVIYYIIYYGLMTDKREREHGNTSEETAVSLVLTLLLSVIFFGITYKIQSCHFIFTL
jgi:ABC-type xylose transport system permease subunit